MNRKIFTVTVALICLFAVGSVMGATTGKITGEIIDAQTNEPLIGVTVAVVGTNLGAITDEDGRYTVLNVPVGTYTLKVTAVGFAELEVINVHVSADLATYQDHELSSKATDLGKTIQVTAEAPLVIKDKTTSIDIVTRDELLAMPTRGFEQVVGIQNSVVRMNVNVDTRQRGFNRASRAQGGELNLRGGRPSEVAYYVDGFSQQDPLTGISTANISNNSIKEVSVTSGAFSAEYGHVASGIVNVTTNAGSDEYHGNVEIVTDNVIPGYDSYDHNYYSADISGPIPGLENGYFFLSGERRYLDDRQPSIKTQEVFDEFGISERYEEPWRLPNNSLSGWSYQGKVDYNFTPNFKLALSGNGSVDRWQQYRHAYNNPRFEGQIEHTPRFEDTNMGLNAKITHTLNAKTFYNLSASFFQTERITGDGTLFDGEYLDYQRNLANPEWDVHNLFREGDSLYASAFDPTIVIGSDEDTFVEYRESYFSVTNRRKSSYIGFKGDITSQMGSHNTAKFGFDFQRHTVRQFNSGDATKGWSELRVNAFGYDSIGFESDDRGELNDTKHPINIGIYLTDRFDWRGLIVNAGLRFDYFDYKALRLRNIERPLDPDGTLLDDDLTNDEGASDIGLDDLEDSEKFTRVSPRLGVSFPVSDKTQMHMNFGKFFQRPDLARLYVGYDFLAARIDAGSFFPFPSPNLEPEKTTQYEFGLTHQMGDNTALTVAFYYKDVQDLVQIFHQEPGFPTAYDTYGNTDFGTIKGLDLGLNMRRTRNISLNLKYTLGYATGTGSYSGSQYNIAWKNSSGTPKQTAPLDYEQRHNIIGVFDVRTEQGEGPVIGDFRPLENFGINTIIALASGTPYTPMNVYDAVSPNASVQQEPTGAINSSNLPWTAMVDVQIERRFKVGSYSIVPYLNIKNLLDRDNVFAVYEGTGKADVSGYLESAEGVERSENPILGEEFAYRYDFGQNNPNNYGSPRTFMFGLRVSF